MTISPPPLPIHTSRTKISHPTPPSKHQIQQAQAPSPRPRLGVGPHLHARTGPARCSRPPIRTCTSTALVHLPWCIHTYIHTYVVYIYRTYTTHGAYARYRAKGDSVRKWEKSQLNRREQEYRSPMGSGVFCECVERPRVKSCLEFVIAALSCPVNGRTRAFPYTHNTGTSYEEWSDVSHGTVWGEGTTHTYRKPALNISSITVAEIQWGKHI